MSDVLKESGMNEAATNRSETLQIARNVAVEIAQSNYNYCHAGLVLDRMERLGMPHLGNAAGSIFKGKHWNFSGKWIKNKRKSAHSRYVRVWHYNG